MAYFEELTTKTLRKERAKGKKPTLKIFKISDLEALLLKIWYLRILMKSKVMRKKTLTRSSPMMLKRRLSVRKSMRRKTRKPMTAFRLREMPER